MTDWTLQLAVVLCALYSIVDAALTDPLSCAVMCELELCLPINKRDCDGEIRPNATMCGCCPNCIRYIDQGRACGDYKMQFPQVPTTMCRPPLECIGGHCLSSALFRRGMRPLYVSRLAHPYSAKTLAMYRAMWK